MRGFDLFCGAGGSSAGARAAGVEMIAAVDMDAVATSTYRANFPNASVLTDRLENLDPVAVRRRIGSIDVLLASPECTNHTCAKGAAPRDEASRATAMQAVRFAEVFKPRWIVLENVVHMRPWSRYGELKRDLECLGYRLKEQVLNASDFGVPQARRRLFLVADRRCEPRIALPLRRGRRKSVKSILDRPGTWATTQLFKEGRAEDTILRARRAMESLGDKLPFLIVYYGSDGSGGWQRLDRPLRTITTVDRFALVCPGEKGPEMRMLQVSELRRAMGFSSDYIFPIGTRRDQIRLLGNGVCPPVMQSVVSALTAN